MKIYLISYIRERFIYYQFLEFGKIQSYEW